MIISKCFYNPQIPGRNSTPNVLKTKTFQKAGPADDFRRLARGTGHHVPSHPRMVSVSLFVCASQITSRTHTNPNDANADSGTESELWIKAFQANRLIFRSEIIYPRRFCPSVPLDPGHGIFLILPAHVGSTGTVIIVICYHPLPTVDKIEPIIGFIILYRL